MVDEAQGNLSQPSGGGGIPRSAPRFSFNIYCVILAFLASGIGALTLMGWILKFPQLTNFGEDLIPMAPSTAVLLLSYGGAILLRGCWPMNRYIQRFSVLIGCLGLIISCLVFVMALRGVHWEGEHLGLNMCGMVYGSPVGHMSAVTAFCFILVSLSLWVLSVSSRWSLRAELTLGIAGLLFGICYVFLLSYLFGTPLLYGGKFIPPALNTLLALTLLSLALLTLSWYQLVSDEGQAVILEETPYLLIMIFIFLALGIIATGYLYYRHYERTYRKEVEGQLAAVAELKTMDLRQWRVERLDDGVILFKNRTLPALVLRFPPILGQVAKRGF